MFFAHVFVEVVVVVAKLAMYDGQTDERTDIRKDGRNEWLCFCSVRPNQKAAR